MLIPSAGVSDVVWAGNQVIAAATDAGSLSLFRYSQQASSVELVGEFPRHHGMATSVSVASSSSGGNAPNVLTGGMDGRVVRWDLDRAQAVEDVRAHAAPVRCVSAANKHASLLASCSLGDRSLLWDMRSQHVSPCQVLPVSTLGTASSFSAGDDAVAVGTVDGTISVFDLRDVSKPVCRYSHGDYQVTRLAFAKHQSSPALLASCGDRLMAMVTSVENSKLEEVDNWVSSDPTAVARGLCWSSNGILHTCGLNCSLYAVKPC